mmetsp:Transcript_14002/g.34179  ORF Transcript_14002/g.34179 Transcript_14002/m.34179 type:complete len:227 (+) Transcript_14002:82-762(+)
MSMYAHRELRTLFFFFRFIFSPFFFSPFFGSSLFLSSLLLSFLTLSLFFSLVSLFLVSPTFELTRAAAGWEALSLSGSEGSGTDEFKVVFMPTMRSWEISESNLRSSVACVLGISFEVVEEGLPSKFLEIVSPVMSSSSDSQGLGLSPEPADRVLSSKSLDTELSTETLRLGADLVFALVELCLFLGPKALSTASLCPTFLTFSSSKQYHSPPSFQMYSSLAMSTF